MPPAILHPPSAILSNTDNASVSLRKLLLESCNLHTVLDCPGGNQRHPGGLPRGLPEGASGS